MKHSLTYACFSVPNTLGPQWQYVVVDVDREQKFAVGFGVSTGELTLDFDVRQHWASRCEEKLWTAIKRASPGTFLDAKALGWVPESVTKMDLSG